MKITHKDRTLATDRDLPLNAMDIFTEIKHKLVEIVRTRNLAALDQVYEESKI